MSDIQRHNEMRREMEARANRMQDSHERAQYAVADQLFETEEALSNRVRIFAAAVLAVSWGLLLEQAGADEAAAAPRVVFDLRLVLGAAVLSIVSLILDFAYWSLRRTALAQSYRRGAGVVGGIGWAVPYMHAVSTLRALVFFAATGVLVLAAVSAFWPVIAGA